MKFIFLALSIGRSDSRFGCKAAMNHSITVRELRIALKGLPDESRLVAFREGKAATISAVRQSDGDKFGVIPGSFMVTGLAKARFESLTVAQMKEEIKDLPEELPVMAIKDGIPAAVYGVSRIGIAPA